MYRFTKFYKSNNGKFTEHFFTGKYDNSLRHLTNQNYKIIFKLLSYCFSTKKRHRL